MKISQNYHKIKESIPDYVTPLIAAKTRSKGEITEVIDAGATDIGQNYVQEAQRIYDQLGEKAKQVRWHMIGPLQRNKINKALGIFDVIQTVDSLRLAEDIDRRAGRVISVYIEVNIAGEKTKHGVVPADVKELIKDISELHNLRIEGLMTLEPYSKNPEDARPYFQAMRKLFEEVRGLDIPNLDMRVLSMGMSNSYKVAIEEGSNMIRIGTAIFGERRVYSA